MSDAICEEFSSQAAPEVLAALRQIAERQGRQFQAVIDDALRDYIHRQANPSDRVASAFTSSLEEFGILYQKLAR